MEHLKLNGDISPLPWEFFSTLCPVYYQQKRVQNAQP